MTNPISEEVQARFWSKVNKRSDSECWDWTHYVRSNGYGEFRFMGQAHKAHRVAYAISNNIWPIPLYVDGNRMDVCHSCVQRQDCVNPNHLRLDTRSSNISDTRAAGRLPTGSAHHWKLRPYSIPKGTETSGAKLLDAQVLYIRRRWRIRDQYPITQRELGIQFDVSQRTISKILLNQRWKHLRPGD